MKFGMMKYHIMTFKNKVVAPSSGTSAILKKPLNLYHLSIISIYVFYLSFYHNNLKNLSFIILIMSIHTFKLLHFSFAVPVYDCYELTLRNFKILYYFNLSHVQTLFEDMGKYYLIFHSLRVFMTVMSQQ